MSIFNELNDSLIKAAKEIYVPKFLEEYKEIPLISERLGIYQKGNGTIRLTIKE